MVIRKNIFSRKNAFLTLFIGIFILSGCGQIDKVKSESSTPIPEVASQHDSEESGTEFTDSKFNQAENRAVDIPLRNYILLPFCPMAD